MNRRKGIPYAGERVSTRLASLVSKIASRCPGKAVPLDLEALAFTLGVARDTVRKATMKLRTRAWFFQGYHTVLFIRYKRHLRAKCGIPQIYAINRHSLHTVGNRARWHLRRRSIEEWSGYLNRLKNLAFAIIFRQLKRADGTHKACCPDESRKIEKAKKANRPGWRPFLKKAEALTAAFAAAAPAWHVNLRGWAEQRFAEGHRFAQMLRCLEHSAAVFEKQRQWAPYDNSKSWLCEVARRHLEADGLTPFIRWREKKRQAAGAATQKENFAVIAGERKDGKMWIKLASGSVILYDPKIADQI